MYNKPSPMPPKALDKAFWAEVRNKPCYEDYITELKSIWTEHCEKRPIYALKYSDFFRFFRDGDRGQYEGPYFTRRLALSSAAILSLIYPEEEKYFIRLQDEIYAICDEYTWALPAHQPYENYNYVCHIDLFATETAFALSEIYTMLEDRLEPLIKSRIRAEIDRRIITPFPTSQNWWDAGGSNWTAVCNCGVACTYMLMRPDLYPTIEKRIARGFDTFLSGFSKEGFCFEGGGYWDYGYGFFTMFADMYYRFTDGRVDFFGDDRARNAATFIQKQFLSDEAGVSFADIGGGNMFYRLGTLHYLKNRYPDCVVVPPKKYSVNYDGCGRFGLHLRSLLWFDEEIVKNEASVSKYAEYYAPDANWYIKRTPSYGFAVKGGRNNEPHNHNDIGTFIYAKNGKQFICDFGAGVYSDSYFGSERYTFAETSSRSHAVPVICGEYQRYGRDYCAREFTYDGKLLHMDIAAAYKVVGLLNYYRDFEFREDGFTVTDTAVFDAGEDAAAEIVSRIPTYENPVVEKDRVIIGDATVRYNPKECRVTVSSEKSLTGRTYNYVDFKFNDGVRKIVLSVE